MASSSQQMPGLLVGSVAEALETSAFDRVPIKIRPSAPCSPSVLRTVSSRRGSASVM